MRVTAIDWHPQSSRILTCSQDRNAYVWTLKADGGWQPSLVLLRTNRAATSAKWNREGDKFVVGLAAGAVAVCSYEASNDWWTSRHIKRPATEDGGHWCVMAVAWHPNGELVAAGALDGTITILNLQGDTVYECRCPTYIHDVQFSADGTYFAAVQHSLEVLISDCQQEWRVEVGTMPMKRALWIGGGQLVVAGYDEYPYLLQASPNNDWYIDFLFARKLMGSMKLAQSSAGDPKQTSDGFRGALSKFKSMSVKESSVVTATTGSSYSQYREVINALSLFGADHQHVCASAINGEMSFWQVSQ